MNDEGFGTKKLDDGETNDREVNDDDIVLEQYTHIGTLDAVADTE